MSNAIVTAAMVAIGDELLSGRTKDKNIGHLADMLTAVGIVTCFVGLAITFPLIGHATWHAYAAIAGPEA